MQSTAIVDTRKAAGRNPLAALRNVGRAALADFATVGITDLGQLAASDADQLYMRLCAVSGTRHDPCVHDVFAAAIHQARTGEPKDWCSFTPARKRRQAACQFPAVADGGNRAENDKDQP